MKGCRAERNQKPVPVIHFVSAEFFNDYLESLYNKNEISRREGFNKISGGTGILYQTGNFRNATEHIDVMYNGEAGGEIYKNQPKNYLYY